MAIVICPMCSKTASYDSYFAAVVCRNCGWMQESKPTNADCIRAGDDEAIAKYGVHRCIPAGCVTPAWYGHFKGYADTREEAIRREVDWLTQPVQEEG